MYGWLNSTNFYFSSNKNNSFRYYVAYNSITPGGSITLISSTMISSPLVVVLKIMKSMAKYGYISLVVPNIMLCLLIPIARKYIVLLLPINVKIYPQARHYNFCCRRRLLPRPSYKYKTPNNIELY